MEAQASAAGATAAAGRAGMGGFAETVLLVVVATVVLRFELLRRLGDLGPGVGARGAASYAESLKRSARRCAPEAAGLVAILTLAAALRARGSQGDTDDPVVLQIRAEWPMLQSADDLLSLQAMLRLVVLASAVLRGASSSPAPLNGQPAALWLCGAAARVALLARSSDYAMEGPLGATVTAAFEVAVLPVLFGMSRGALGKAPSAILFAGAGAAFFAFRNRLNLSGDAVSDSLFVFAHCCDLLAALTYLLRAALIEASGRGGVSVGFAHVLMPFQASLSAYYFMQAFPHSAELVGEGQPFAVLQVANAVACGAYLAAAALYVAECLEQLGGSFGDEPQAQFSRRGVAV